MYTYVYTECIHIECRHRYSGLYKVVVPQITIPKNKTMYITRGLPNGSMGYHYFGQLPYVSMCINLCYSCLKKAKLRSTFDLLSVLQRQQLLKLWFCSLACHQAWPWKILVKNRGIVEQDNEQLKCTWFNRGLLDFIMT